MLPTGTGAIHEMREAGREAPDSLGRHPGD